MSTRPYVLLSVAMSLDGFVDHIGDNRLVLSNDADLDRVDELRAGSDAILVGANTIRRDDPRLVVHSAARQAARENRGEPANPTKVTLSRGGELDPAARFFTYGNADKIIYVGSSAVANTRGRLPAAVQVVDGGDPLSVERVLDDLAGRGIRRLMVEGGTRLSTELLGRGLIDELQLAIAPLFVGDARAPRFVGDAVFAWSASHRARLADVGQVGDIALLRYALSSRFEAQ